MPIENMTPEQIAEATRAVVTAGGSSTDRNNRLKGETATEANARITAAYKELTAKPILSKEQIEGGMKVQFVREGAGGFGTYIPIKPPGYKGPTEVTNFTDGIVPKGTKYTTGSRVGLDIGNRTADEYRKVLVGKLTAGNKLTAEEKAWLDANGKTSLNPNVTKVTSKIPVVTTLTNKGFETKDGILYNNGKPFNGKASDGKTYIEGEIEEESNDGAIPTDRPIGTPPAFVYDPVSKTYKMPPKPTQAGTWAFDNNEGWVDTSVNPGSTGFEAGANKTLALDTFKNTLALFFGPNEVSQPWTNALFQVVSNFYKSGSTIDESLNLALRDARNNPLLKPFTDRFAGVYALQDRRAKGEAIDVPTIADFFKSQEELGTRLRQVGLGDLATNEILGEVLGTGKSVAAVLNLVDDVFMTIDNAPEQLKRDLQSVAPGVDRTSIAKALLLGKRGAEELQKKIKEVSVLSAAKSQGITISNALAADLAAGGAEYGSSLTNFGTVAKGAPDLQKLTEISTGQAVKPVSAQESIIKSLFQQDVKEQERIRLEEEKEIARFSGASGLLGSRSLASRNRANRTI
jgi:hypothetical protein